MRVERIGEATLYLGDCLEVLDIRDSLPNIDAVVTDPPYPDYHTQQYGLVDIGWLAHLKVPQFIFWSAKADFPLDYTAIHIWHKRGNGVASMYERIFERNGGSEFRVFTANSITNHTTARFGRDHFNEHPSQKPIALLRELVAKTSGLVLDPFMGSGTAGVACANFGRPFVGIEINSKYFDIACERIAAAYAQGRLFT